MVSKPLQRVEEYPSLLWIAVPSVFLVSAYFINKWWKAYQLKNYGIGRGAAGFQTGVRRVRVTPDVALKIRRGEQVSPEEIAESVRKMEEMERQGIKPTIHIEDEKPFIREKLVQSNKEEEGEATLEGAFLIAYIPCDSSCFRLQLMLFMMGSRRACRKESSAEYCGTDHRRVRCSSTILLTKMRFPSLVALVSLASCVLAQDVNIADVVTAFNNARIPADFGITFNPTALLQVTFTRNGVPTTFSSGANVPRDATAPIPTFKISGTTDPGPFVIATVDPDGGQFGQVRHFLAGNYQNNNGDLANTTAPITAWFQPSPGAGNPAHRYVFWAYKQSANFNQQRLVTAQTFIGNWNLSSFAAQTGLGDPVAASFMLVRQ